MHEYIELSFLGYEFFGDIQRAKLVGLQRDFLREHDIARDEVGVGYKTPTNSRAAGAVDLLDIHRGAMMNPVSLSAVATGDVEIPVRVVLRELLRR